MFDQWRRAAATALGAAVMAYPLAGCGNDDSPSTSSEADPPPVIMPGLGLGEWSDDGAGDRRVLRVADPETDVDAPADRTVTALVQICAPAGQPAVPAQADWRLVLDHGDPADATGPPRPTDQGSPALADSGRIDPDQCAFADVDFAVPSGSTTVGMLYRSTTGELVRWSWSPDDARPASS